MIGSIPNFDDVKASGDFQKLPAGGYVILIKGAEEKISNDKPYVEITYDIAEGQYKDFYKDTDADHTFIHQFRQYHNEKSLGMFKGFLLKLDESNDTAFAEQIKSKALDEKKFIGKRLGVVFGYEQYTNERGEDKQRMYVSAIKSVADIHEGKFNVPDLRIKETSPKSEPGIIPGFENDDSNLPF